MPWLILGGGFLTMWVASQLSGVPLFKELQQRADRMIERHLPVTPVKERSRIALAKRLDETGLKLGTPVFIRVFKQEAEMEVWLRDGERYRKLHTYPICKFSGFLGPKLKEGDRQAPEGFYAVTEKQLNPGSRNYLAFNLAFPNEYDRAHGRTGSALMVHGGCTSIGCYAMTDVGVGEIYRVVESALKRGQIRVPVHIFPFRMTEKNLAAQPIGKWTGFWRNIKQGNDLFEQNKVPPKVGVCDRRYVFGEKAKKCRTIAGWG